FGGNQLLRRDGAAEPLPRLLRGHQDGRGLWLSRDDGDRQRSRLLDLLVQQVGDGGVPGGVERDGRGDAHIVGGVDDADGVLALLLDGHLRRWTGGGAGGEQRERNGAPRDARQDPGRPPQQGGAILYGVRSQPARRLLADAPDITDERPCVRAWMPAPVLGGPG